MKLRKLLLIAIAALSLSSLASCDILGGGGSSNQPSSENPTSSEISSMNPEDEGIDVTGTKTDTSLTVDFYYNQPNKGIYKRYYVEPGEKIRKFNCLVSGLKFVGFFYDEYGVNQFDFSTPINENLTLYAYHLGNGAAPETYPFEDQGEYKITWGRVLGASYQEANGEALPLTANKGQTVEFKLVKDAGTNKVFQISVNGQVVSPNSDGVYSVTIEKNTRISTAIVGNEERTYVVEANPEWLQNDGCVIFGWVWEAGKEGHWVEATLEGTTFSFTTDEELAGFLFVRCVRGTSTPNWSTGGDAAGRIYNKTIDFICVPGVTTYNGSTAWVQYNVG